MVILVGLSVEPTDPSPKGELAVIFGVVGAWIFLLLAVQGIELRRASEARTTPAVAPGTPVENPMTMEPVDLWAAMATKPVGDEHARAHDEAWGTARSSHRTAIVVCALIFVCVPMTYLLETFVPVLVGAALIALVAIVAVVKVLGGGGGLDRAYETTDRALEPLGLRLDERPTVGVTSQSVHPYGLKKEVHGALRFSGRRHGRGVEVKMDGGASEVRVHVDTPSFEARSRDGKVRPKRGEELPPGVAAALESVPASTEWKNLTVRGDADGVVVRRKPSAESWLPDLWLAERIAASLG